jgi:hypothetical protein
MDRGGHGRARCPTAEAIALRVRMVLFNQQKRAASGHALRRRLLGGEPLRGDPETNWRWNWGSMLVSRYLVWITRRS